MKLKKVLKGFSGSKILIYNDGKKNFVRKKNNIKRNIIRFKSLKKVITLPKIYNVKKNYFDMEYIDGLSIEQYLIENDIKTLLDFINKTLNKLSKIKYEFKDYSNTYKNFLKDVNFNETIFSKKNLIDKLPKRLIKTQYHGDFTLENILFKENKFYLIDWSEGIFDSYIFDYSKLRQDIETLWFLRDKENINNTIYLKLNYLKKELSKRFKYYNNKYLLILMLLRVYKYTKKDTFEKNFLLKRINKTWKS
tara:strand:+ start:1048 stop:1797 length:750 start_codon:yes stop_codon:yes gene_type:complete